MDQITTGAQGVILASATLAAVLYIIGRIWRAWRRVTKFAERLEKVMVNVELQLYPNHGTSLRDAVNRIQDHLGVSDIPAEEPTR